MTKPPTIRARITRSTTLKGEKRFKIVKAGAVVDLDVDTFWLLKGQGQCEKVEGKAEPDGDTKKSSKADKIETEDKQAA